MINKKLLIIASILLFTASCSGSKKNSDIAKTLPKNQQQSPVSANPVKEVAGTAINTVSGEIPEARVVFFDTDKFAIKPAGKALLDGSVIPWMNANPKVKITVNGYCDERGGNSYNKKLGKNRAKVVKRYLVDAGVKPSRIKAISYGEANPVDPDHTQRAWSKNRRVVTSLAKATVKKPIRKTTE